MAQTTYVLRGQRIQQVRADPRTLSTQQQQFSSNFSRFAQLHQAYHYHQNQPYYPQHGLYQPQAHQGMAPPYIPPPLYSTISSAQYSRTSNPSPTLSAANQTSNTKVSNDSPPSSSKPLSVDQHWLTELKQYPQDETALVSGHLNMILSKQTHKFGNTIDEFHKHLLSTRAFHDLKKQNSDEQFKEVTDNIVSFMNRTIDELDKYFGGLIESGISPNFRRLARRVLEEKLWTKIYNDIFPLFQRKFQEEDQIYSSQMSNFKTLILPHLGVKQLFWLMPTSGTGVGADNTYPLDRGEDFKLPYSTSIQIFQSISTIRSPQQKIQCLSRVAKEIVKNIQECWKEKLSSDQAQIGADDLIPLMSYVILKSGVSHLESHSKFMETFIDEKDVIEEGGYMIATLQTCLSFLGCLNKEDVESSATEMFEKAQQKNFLAIPEKKETQKDIGPSTPPDEDLIEW